MSADCYFFFIPLRPSFLLPSPSGLPPQWGRKEEEKFFGEGKKSGCFYYSFLFWSLAGVGVLAGLVLYVFFT
jgi:hypothetical protein